MLCSGYVIVFLNGPQHRHQYHQLKLVSQRVYHGKWFLNHSPDVFEIRVDPLTPRPGRQYHSYYGTDKNLLPEDEIEHER